MTSPDRTGLPVTGRRPPAPSPRNTHTPPLLSLTAATSGAPLPSKSPIATAAVFRPALSEGPIVKPPPASRRITCTRPALASPSAATRSAWPSKSKSAVATARGGDEKGSLSKRGVKSPATPFRTRIRASLNVATARSTRPSWSKSAAAVATGPSGTA